MQPNEPRPQLDEATLLRAWCEWNAKSLKDYLGAILRLAPEERCKDRGASFGSIQDIFLHILEDYIWWFEQVPQNKLEDYPEFVGKKLSAEELTALTQRVDRVIRSTINFLKPSELGRKYIVKGTSGDGKPYTMTTCLADTVWHMVEEQLQHLGEINALFWQIDLDPPTRAWFSSEYAYSF
jgi:uncharacterized damage-inducible protein DinB